MHWKKLATAFSTEVLVLVAPRTHMGVRGLILQSPKPPSKGKPSNQCRILFLLASRLSS